MGLLVIAGAGLLFLGSGSPSAPTEYNGLRGRLFVDPATVALGDAVEFRLDLNFDPTAASPNTVTLDCHASRYEFVFLDTNTGAKFERKPIDYGGPIILPKPEDEVALSSGAPVRIEGIHIYLLSEYGQQIPPGTYTVRALYLNEGRSRRRSAPEPNDGDFWQGRVMSAPCTLVVQPAFPKSIEVQVPTKLRIDTTSRAPFLGWAFADLKTIRVLKRPGFALGWRWYLHGYSGGKEIMSPRCISTGQWTTEWQFSQSEGTVKLLSDKSSELIFDLEVFESSNQIEPHWNPERGDFKILWTGQVQQKLFKN